MDVSKDGRLVKLNGAIEYMSNGWFARVVVEVDLQLLLVPSTIVSVVDSFIRMFWQSVRILARSFVL